MGSNDTALQAAVIRPVPTKTPFVNLGTPVCEGPEGIRYDYNHGCRVQVPGAGWRVRLTDLDTDSVLFDAWVLENARVTSTKKYFVNIRIEVFKGERLVFDHAYNAAGKRVYARMPISTLGDTLAWFPYVEEFRRKHGCEMVVSMGEALWTLFRDAYPEIQCIAPADEPLHQDSFYASYYLGIFYPCTDRTHQPVDPRVSGLQQTIAYLLGVPAIARRARIAVPERPREIPEPYVCIAAQATSQCKYWNHPSGWYELVRHLKSANYRVLCIDQKSTHGRDGFFNVIPFGSEDFTGERPLLERAALLQHAAFFVGLSSGLAWLAWSLGKPVVMISGFTHPLNEFDTPYRVTNYHACNSCANDTTIEFDQGNFAWCPRHAGTSRQFECTRLIAPAHVMKTVDALIHDLRVDPHIQDGVPMPA